MFKCLIRKSNMIHMTIILITYSSNKKLSTTIFLLFQKFHLKTIITNKSYQNIIIYHINI